MLVKIGRNRAGVTAQIVDDVFTPVADGEALPDGAIVVSFKRFEAERESLLARNLPLGVRLETAESPEGIAPFLPQLALVELHVPYFRDGRAFSWARLLRTRLNYKGEIRVSGHVLIDQMPFYARVGADAFAVAQNVPLSEIEAAFHQISNVYQPATDGRPTIQQLRASGTHLS